MACFNRISGCLRCNAQSALTVSETMRKVAYLLPILFCWALVFVAEPAQATRLEVAHDAPVWAHLGAATLLYLHIGGGVIGLVMGALAIASRKGSTLHRTVGHVFFVSMFVTYLIGAGVAPFLTDGQRPNFVAGILALYLLVSGWQTARRRHFVAGRSEYIGLAIALTITGLGLLFMVMGAGSPTGTVDGTPPQAFVIFVIAGALAAAGEIRVIWKGGISGVARIARHLWRMCFSLFIASASLFLGQPQVFPAGFNASPLPALLALAPLVAMAAWLVLVRRKRFVLRGS